jgi:hypothetical protein
MSVLRKPKEQWTAADTASQPRVGAMPGDAVLHETDLDETDIDSADRRPPQSAAARSVTGRDTVAGDEMDDTDMDDTYDGEIVNSNVDSGQSADLPSVDKMDSRDSVARDSVSRDPVSRPAPSGIGRQTPKQASAPTVAGDSAASPKIAAGGQVNGRNESPLFAENELRDFRARWDQVQTSFVDEPRHAVEQADTLVATVVKRIAEQFAEERSKLEKQWDRGDNVSTEELRQGFQRYRAFFDRLLSF